MDNREQKRAKKELIRKQIRKQKKGKFRRFLGLDLGKHFPSYQEIMGMLKSGSSKNAELFWDTSSQGQYKKGDEVELG